MSRIFKFLARITPIGFLWRLTFLNILVVVMITSVSGLTIYKGLWFHNKNNLHEGK